MNKKYKLVILASALLLILPFLYSSVYAKNGQGGNGAAQVPLTAKLGVPANGVAVTPNLPAASNQIGQGNLITVTGLVTLKNSSTLIAPLNTFNMTAGRNNYTVIVDNSTSNNTKVINLLNKQVGNNFIQVNNYVTVSGTLNGSTITAKIIQVQTSKDMF